LAFASLTTGRAFVAHLCAVAIQLGRSFNPSITATLA
jgi:hypothetical protein